MAISRLAYPCWEEGWYYTCSNDFYLPSRHPRRGGEGASTLWAQPGLTFSNPPFPSSLGKTRADKREVQYQRAKDKSTSYMHTNVGRSKVILEEVTLVSSLCERPVGFQRAFSLYYISFKFRVKNAFAVFFKMFSRGTAVLPYFLQVFAFYQRLSRRGFLKRIFFDVSERPLYKLFTKTYHSKTDSGCQQ